MAQSVAVQVLMQAADACAATRLQRSQSGEVFDQHRSQRDADEVCDHSTAAALVDGVCSALCADMVCARPCWTNQRVFTQLRPISTL